MEEMYIKAINNSIFKLKNGGMTTDDESATKKKAATALNKLKDINLGMYEELLGRYKETLAGLK